MRTGVSIALGEADRQALEALATDRNTPQKHEGFFAKLTRRRLKNGVFYFVVDLQTAINRFLAEHNESPKPFIWRADPDAIIAARCRGFQALESIH